MQSLAGPPARLPAPTGVASPARLSTETKAAYKTTEFITYVVVFAGILLASFLVKTARTASGPITSGPTRPGGTSPC